MFYSGLASFLLNELSEEFTCLNCAVFPAFEHGDQHRPWMYDSLMCLQYLTEFAAMIWCIDNENILKRYKEQHKLDIHSHVPPFKLNSIIGNLLPDLTSWLRFPSEFSSGNLRTMSINLVPHLHSQFIQLGCSEFELMSNLELRESMFSQSNFYSRYPIHDPKISFTSIHSHGSGSGLESLQLIQSEFKLAVESRNKIVIPSNCIPHSKTLKMSHLVNSTSITKTLQDILNIFSSSFKRKTNIWQYYQHGMEDLEFTEAENTLRETIDHYQVM